MAFLSQQLLTLPNELIGEDGEWIHIHKLSRDQAAPIADVKVRKRMIESGDNLITNTWREYKLVDRLKAAELLARHHGLFKKDRSQKKPSDDSIKLVAMPSGDLTLAEWARQVEVMNAAMAKKAEHSGTK